MSDDFDSVRDGVADEDACIAEWEQEDDQRIAEWEQEQEEKNQQADQCVRRIVACFKAVKKEIGHEQALEMFDTFLEVPGIRPPRGKTGPKVRRISKDVLKLVADYDAATRGEKLSVLVEYEECHGLKPKKGKEGTSALRIMRRAKKSPAYRFRHALRKG
jgi:hypothetical protein